MQAAIDAVRLYEQQQQARFAVAAPGLPGLLEGLEAAAEEVEGDGVVEGGIHYDSDNDIFLM